MTPASWSIKAWQPEARSLIRDALESGRPSAIAAALDAAHKQAAIHQAPAFSLGISSTFTLGPQQPALELGLSTIPSNPQIVISDHDTIEQDLLDPASPLLVQPLDALLVLWRAEELMAELLRRRHMLSKDQRHEIIDQAAGRVQQLVSAYTEASPLPLFLSTLPSSLMMAGDVMETNQPAGILAAIARLNETVLACAAENPGVHVFDFAGWTQRQKTGWYSSKMDFVAKQPIAAQAAPFFGSYLAEHFRPLVGPMKKVLAVDLDNTLWGGVLGEDGIAGLSIGQDYPGKLYWRVQELVASLKARGVILILLSKNNAADMEEAFATRSDMPLSLTDFTVIKANWRPKADNLQEAIDELRLGLDSVVFIDDQAIEREAMRFHLPDVEVPEIGEDPLEVIEMLAQNPWFARYGLTDADLQRSEDYLRESERRKLRAASSNLETFLRSLEMRMTVDPLGTATIPRAAQMCARTNQFNVTTKRHSEADLAAFVADDGIYFTATLSDRFSNQGIIALCLGRPINGASDVREIEIDSLLISCRALGRGVERALFAAFVASAARAGYARIRASFLKTKKNGQCENLFADLGMSLETSGPDAKHYVLELPATVDAPDWIEFAHMDV